ncbi:AMP-dependent synthetase [Salinadaptatus halalkaliphilus]|uniref:AMP-dependent synthetase n=1 Tax=Salinadaptatus halalkaliphilus TaxID=2419781 RepID=A0A4S3TNV8_9EURY|nr:AMP-binding protein [Salinadaptatus halalkaliphilus]THE66009.1 AMP-dependent synthetase [Salinadaptatus halalkaliphilus]
MTYESIYDTVFELYDSDRCWDELVTQGDRSSLNLAEEALGRHGDSQEVGVRLRDFETGANETYTFAELDDAANRVANFVAESTSNRDRVAAMLPARIELYAAAYGVIKSGRVYVPLAPLFGPEALQFRLADSGASVLVTTAEHVSKLEGEALPDLETVVVVDGADAVDTADIPTGIDLESYDAVEKRESDFEPVASHPSDVYAIKYTSGTTGQPKGCASTHGDTIRLHSYLEHVVDLQPADNYFVAASPAWSYGFTAGMVAAGLRGTAAGCYRGPFNPEQLLETFEEFEITNAMVPPTGLRKLRASAVDPSEYDIDLRVLVSAGESLDETTVDWCDEMLGTRPLDAYGQTESGMVVANYPFPDWEVKAGSMGKPLPGYEIALLDDDGEPVEQGEVGEIAVRRDAETRTAGYWGHPETTITSYSGEWWRTGDLARRDEDGYYWYVSRADQVIISSGYRIGPEEVEEALLKHEAVEEAAVVGVPDETRGSIVKAVVVPVADATPNDALASELQSFARSNLSKHEYPRGIEFVAELPKTSSGKIKRTELEA